MKIQVRKISIQVAEGEVFRVFKDGKMHYSDHPHIEVKTWKEAEDFIRKQAHIAPGPNDGYYKTDFEVEWEDNAIYKGRYDLSQEDIGVLNPIGSHIYREGIFWTGKWYPRHMTEVQYQAFIKEYSKNGEIYREILDKYDLGEVYLA